MYQVNVGWTNYGTYVSLITDDLYYARQYLLQRIKKSHGSFGIRNFQDFEEKFKKCVDNGFMTGCYFSLNDCHYSIQKTDIKVVIGGMSTLQKEGGVLLDEYR